VVVRKERSPLSVAFVEAVEVRVERVGELARAAARIDRVCGSVEDRPKLAHEVIPRRLAAGGAGDREREVLEVQRFEEPTRLVLPKFAIAGGVCRARDQRTREDVQRYAPSIGAGALVEARGKGLVDARRLHPSGPYQRR